MSHPSVSSAPASSVGGIRLPIAAAAVLTVVSCVLGVLPWPRPEWSTSGWEIAATTPIALWLVVGGTAAVCLTVAARVTTAVAPLELRRPAGRLWLTITVLAASSLVVNVIYSAALSTIDFGVPIPIFHWLFTAAPAFLAGAASIGRDRRARVAAAVGTGVVTLPLFALGWALLLSPSPLPGSGTASYLMGLLGVLHFTAILGVLPLVVAAALAAALSQDPSPVPSSGAAPTPATGADAAPNPVASWALVFGIGGVVLSWLLPIGGTEFAFFIGVVLGLVLSLIATGLGWLGLRRARARGGANKGQALAATIVGAAGLLLNLPLAVELALVLTGAL